MFEKFLKKGCELKDLGKNWNISNNTQEYETTKKIKLDRERNNSITKITRNNRRQRIDESLKIVEK